MPINLTSQMIIKAKEQIKQQNDSKRAEIMERSKIVPKGTVLYVNGKERKIGKKSQYLLDMLTLED